VHEFRTTLAKAIRDLRVKANLTQAQLAAKLKLSVPHVSYLENGHSVPSIETLRNYRAILGHDPYCVAGLLLEEKKIKERKK
jgi:transcriptional regulator with XRE-family HTH domain